MSLVKIIESHTQAISSDHWIVNCCARQKRTYEKRKHKNIFYSNKLTPPPRTVSITFAYILNSTACQSCWLNYSIMPTGEENVTWRFEQSVFVMSNCATIALTSENYFSRLQILHKPVDETKLKKNYTSSDETETELTDSSIATYTRITEMDVQWLIIYFHHSPNATKFNGI